ncbi:MAG TPA: nucleoside-triphosphatase [Candidatus Rifleibacterium sp.]|nr:nucleoside-triphosphatase [Candidatus Rifleibacterium sp.]HPT48160.1 nucleoside-triphosphatase [Candidatus Rifleibacterium sp.]
MIYILTGPINSGKTSWILKDFQSHPEADGFACKKVFTGGEHIGYDLVHLPTGMACPFIRVAGHLPPGWEEVALLNERFSFSAAGLLFARHITQNAILNSASRFYIDEIGPLELSGRGFNHLLTALLGAEIDLVIAIRDSKLPEILAAFKITSYELINR